MGRRVCCVDGISHVQRTVYCFCYQTDEDDCDNLLEILGEPADGFIVLVRGITIKGHSFLCQVSSHHYTFKALR